MACATARNLVFPIRKKRISSEKYCDKWFLSRGEAWNYTPIQCVCWGENYRAEERKLVCIFVWLSCQGMEFGGSLSMMKVHV